MAATNTRLSGLTYLVDPATNQFKLDENGRKIPCKVFTAKSVVEVNVHHKNKLTVAVKLGEATPETEKQSEPEPIKDPVLDPNTDIIELPPGSTPPVVTQLPDGTFTTTLADGTIIPTTVPPTIVIPITGGLDGGFTQILGPNGVPLTDVGSTAPLINNGFQAGEVAIQGAQDFATSVSPTIGAGGIPGLNAGGF